MCTFPSFPYFKVSFYRDAFYPYKALPRPHFIGIHFIPLRHCLFVATPHPYKAWIVISTHPFLYDQFSRIYGVLVGDALVVKLLHMQIPSLSYTNFGPEHAQIHTLYVIVTPVQV